MAMGLSELKKGGAVTLMELERLSAELRELLEMLKVETHVFARRVIIEKVNEIMNELGERLL